MKAYQTSQAVPSHWRKKLKLIKPVVCMYVWTLDDI